MHGPAVILLQGWPYDNRRLCRRRARAGSRRLPRHRENLRGYGSTRFSDATFRNAQPSALAMDVTSPVSAISGRRSPDVEKQLTGGVRQIDLSFRFRFGADRIAVSGPVGGSRLRTLGSSGHVSADLFLCWRSSAETSRRLQGCRCGMRKCQLSVEYDSTRAVVLRQWD